MSALPTPAQIRAARAAASLSQAEAAALCGAGRRSWAAWEGGERPIPPSRWRLFLLTVETGHSPR